MLALDRGRRRERRDRSGCSRDAGAPATRERKPLDGAIEQLRGRGGPAGRSPGERSPRGHHSLPDGRGGFPGGAASSVARGRGIWTTRSNRSSSARDRRSRYAVSRCAVHPQRSPGSPRPPHGQRFIVPTSWNRAGYVARPPTRATETNPSSSGCRSASSVLRANSGNSSSSKTPRCARLVSPGLGCAPPPTSAAVEAPWCGARNGGTVTSTVDGGRTPATEWILVTSSASSGVRGGRIPGSRRASIVFPVPGGPASSRLCAPAAAISSARRPRS